MEELGHAAKEKGLEQRAVLKHHDSKSQSDLLQIPGYDP